MGFKEEFLSYVSEKYKDIAFMNKSESLFPDIATGYSQVRIVYNRAYHALDMRFANMGDYEDVFGKYVYPVLMKYRDFSIWKMSSNRVIRVKVPCISEEVGFQEEDCDIQMGYVRTLMEILSQIDVGEMYASQREKREASFKSLDAIAMETETFLGDYKAMLNDRKREYECVGRDSYGKKGLLYRLSCMSKDIASFISAHEEYVIKYPDSKITQELMNYKNQTDFMIKEIL